MGLGYGEGDGDGDGCVGRVVVGGAGLGITVGEPPQLRPASAAPTVTIQTA